MNLFFIPYAGGSARSYITFKPHLNTSIKICPLEIAGRGMRINEPRFSDIKECAKDLLQRNKEAFEKEDYAIFGHSMGTLITYELVKQIVANNVRLPKHIFLSGRKPLFWPVSIVVNDPSELTDEALISFMRQCGDLPDILLQNEELLKMSLSILHDDILMADAYKYIDNPVCCFPCDITVIYGKQDLLDCSHMEEWKQFTTCNCNIIGMDGNHFYYREHLKEVGDIINKTLDNYII